MTSQFNMNCFSAHQFDWLVLLELAAKSRTQRTNTNKVIVDWPKNPRFCRTFEGWFGPTVLREYIAKELNLLPTFKNNVSKRRRMFLQDALAVATGQEWNLFSFGCFPRCIDIWVPLLTHHTTSKQLGHFSVFSHSQCWCTGLGADSSPVVSHY